MDLRPLHKRASFPVSVGKAHGPKTPMKATQKLLGSYLFYFAHFCGQEESLAFSLIQHFCFKRRWPAHVFYFHRNSSLFLISSILVLEDFSIYLEFLGVVTTLEPHSLCR